MKLKKIASVSLAMAIAIPAITGANSKTSNLQRNHLLGSSTAYAVSNRVPNPEEFIATGSVSEDRHLFMTFPGVEIPPMSEKPLPEHKTGLLDFTLDVFIKERVEKWAIEIYGEPYTVTDIKVNKRGTCLLYTSDAADE